MTRDEEREVFWSARNAGYFDEVLSLDQAEEYLAALLGEPSKNYKIDFFPYEKPSVYLYKLF